MSEVIELGSRRHRPGGGGSEPPPETEPIAVASMNIVIFVRDIGDEIEVSFENGLELAEGLGEAWVREQFRWAFLETGKKMRMGIRRRKKGER